MYSFYSDKMVRKNTFFSHKHNIYVLLRLTHKNIFVIFKFLIGYCRDGYFKNSLAFHDTLNLKINLGIFMAEV